MIYVPVTLHLSEIVCLVSDYFKQFAVSALKVPVLKPALSEKIYVVAHRIVTSIVYVRFIS